VLGIALQETNFIDKITVGETLDLFASFFGRDSDVTPRILELIRLSEKRRSYVMNLSHGMRQRLSLGIALINDPEILILDEPTTGLDPNARREVWSILLDLKKQAKTSLILTTHYMEEAELLCDHIIIMDRGKVLAEGTMDELVARYGDEAIAVRRRRESRAVSLDDIFTSLTGRHLDE
jgi:ABC-2 type transport system ATP-binding protein